MAVTEVRRVLRELERIIRQDAAGRGLTAGEAERGALAAGELGLAVHELASRATGVVLFTGFFIPRGTPPAAETDGPPGTVLLADVLTRLEVPAWVVTDPLCSQAVRAAARAAGWDPACVLEYPWPTPTAAEEFDPGPPAAREEWRRRFWEWARAQHVSHCVAIERVGPAHDEQSLALQPRTGPVPFEEFRRRVRPADQGVCHNMRGVPLDRHTGDLHRLFEEAVADPRLATVGVGDGGNELGMGRVLWEDLAFRLAGEQSGRVPCRVGCDQLVVAGVSNWGAQALAIGMAWQRGRLDLLERHSPAAQFRVLEEMVRSGPAVDGVTGQPTLTVDGLDFPRYIAPWEAMVQLVQAR
ncbi:MAG: glutamate cyclase domain-containing protein [Planctomycetaceae bacterium]